MFFLESKFHITPFVALVVALVGFESANADIVFDFSTPPGDYVEEAGAFDHSGFLTREGLTVRLAGHSDFGLFRTLGKVNLVDHGIGISIDDAANNDTSLFDRSQSDSFGDVNERLLLSFDKNVRVTSFTIRGLGDGSVARLFNDPDNTGDTIGDLQGTANLLDTFDVSGQNIILQSGQQIGLGYVNGGGFQLASFSATAIPEPNCILLSTLVLTTAIARRRRNKYGVKY